MHGVDFRSVGLDVDVISGRTREVERLGNVVVEV